LNSQGESRQKLLRVTWWTLFGLVLVLIVLIRIRLFEIPLERDEGEYAYAGQLMLQGIPPYKLLYSMKFPGTAAAYALIMWLFGQTTVGIHLGLLLVNAATIAFVLFVGRRLFGEIAGLAAGASYAVLSIGPAVLGFAGHATHFVAFAMMAGTWILLEALDRKSKIRLFLSGTLFGIALLMKQAGAPFLGFALVYLLLSAWKTRSDFREVFVQMTVFVAGALWPCAVVCLVLWRAGVFPNFWFWSVEYARAYATQVPLSVGWKNLLDIIPLAIGPNIAIWVIAATGLFIAIWKFKSGLNQPVLILLLLFSVGALALGLNFRQHYFILALPAIALLTGSVAYHAAHLPLQKLPRIDLMGPILFAAILGWPLIAERGFLFSAPPDSASRFIYWPNPFAESVQIAKFLREHTEPNDTIAILGSEPQIYFYAKRHSATGYIYTYGLMEPQPFAERMQQEMAGEIEAARPKYVVFVAIPYSWLRHNDSKDFIFDWFEDYSVRKLNLIGLVNLVSPHQSDYYLPYASEPVTLSPFQISIYERKL
jgi:4-amino-4-deoxy-L-arabinose transferase-like glycosyltransferase